MEKVIRKSVYGHVSGIWAQIQQCRIEILKFQISCKYVGFVNFRPDNRDNSVYIDDFTTPSDRKCAFEN